MTATSVEGDAPRQHATLDLRVLLAALPAIVVVPLVIFASSLLYVLADQARRDAEHDLRQDVQTLAAHLERDLGAATHLLRLMSEMPELQADPPDLQRFERFARRAVGAGYGFDSLLLVERDGRRLIDTTYPPGTQWVGPVRPHHQASFDTGGPAISDLFTRMQDGKLAVSLGVPVLRGDAVTAVLSVTLTPSHFLRLLPERARDKGVVVSVLDRGNRIIVRGREPQKWVGKPADPRAAAAFRSAAHGVTQFASFEGEPTVWSWQTLGQGWVVTIGMPASAYQGPLRASIVRLAAAGGLVLLAALAVAAFFGSRINRSVRTMGDNAQRLLEGERPPFRSSGVRQLDRLYGVFETASQRLASAHAERERAYQAERLARAEAESANRAKDEFLAMLSHELRNPLPPIVNMVKFLARREPLTEAGRKAVEMIERQVAQIAKLIDDLMEANRVTKGKIRLHPGQVKVAELVIEVVEAAEASGGERAPRIVVSGAQSGGEILADPVRIRQVFENLLDNAIKFSRHTDHPIDVDIQGDTDAVRVSVTDRGAGIEPAQLHRVFDLFAQADATFDRAQGGLGIGLALVRALVRMHGGSVTAHSEGRGAGARFTVELPRRPPPSAPVSRGADASITDEITKPAAPMRRISDRLHDAATGT